MRHDFQRGRSKAVGVTPLPWCDPVRVNEYAVVVYDPRAYRTAKYMHWPVSVSNYPELIGSACHWIVPGTLTRECFE